MKYLNNCIYNMNVLIIIYFYLSLIIITIYASYDSNTAQYTPTGRVLQIEYAKQAIDSKGGPIAVMKCKDGILLTIARYISKNKLIRNSPQKVFLIDHHIMITASGSLSEGMQLIQIAKQEALKYKELHGNHIPIENLCEYLSNVLHLLTIESKHRPVGVSLIITGWDEFYGPQIYSIDPDGSFAAWNAIAIGKESKDVKKSLKLLMDSYDNPQQLSIESIWDRFKTMIINKHFDTSIIKPNIIPHNHYINQQQNNKDRYAHKRDKDISITKHINSNSLSDIFEFDIERDINDDAIERYWQVKTYCCMKNSKGDIDWTLVTM